MVPVSTFNPPVNLPTAAQDYKATQKLAAEREAQSLPRAPVAQRQPTPATATGGGSEAVEANLEQQALLQQQQVAEARQMDNAISYNEALIEERDHNIAEISRQIGEVNEMFQVIVALDDTCVRGCCRNRYCKVQTVGVYVYVCLCLSVLGESVPACGGLLLQDLAVLINDQGEQLQTIDVHIASTAERVREGQRQLVKAERSQRAARNKCLFLWLISGVVLSVILIVLFA